VSRAVLQLWGWPLAIFLVSATGLASALVADGWGDAWSWFALAVPVAVSGWCAWPRRPRQQSTERR
jgi:hypothetical protein